jgi:hypothetical protein
MNIVVIIPKKEEDHFREEISEDAEAWWTLPKRPRKLDLGDKVWFQLKGDIIAHVQVVDIREENLVCDSTGREWKGIHLVWNGGDLKYLKNPVPGVKLTRGFQYYDGPEI